MNSKTQIYFDPNDLHLGYIDSNGNPQHVLTDAFIKDGTIRVNDGYLEYKDVQGVWHAVIDGNGNPAYLTGPLGPVGDTGNTGPQGRSFRILNEDQCVALAERLTIERSDLLRMFTTYIYRNDIPLMLRTELIGFLSDENIPLYDIFSFDGWMFQVTEADENIVLCYLGQKLVGQTPYLFEHDGWINVTYDPDYQDVPYKDLDCYELFEYVPMSDVTELQTTVSDLQTDVTNLLDTVDHICNTFDQGGDDWTEESMPYINPEALSWNLEFNDVPHYVIWHDYQLNGIGYESGELLEEESYPLYGEHEGYTDPAQITYNLYGDYCTVSVSNLLLINGWSDIYFRLPVEPVEETNTIFMAREGSDYQQVCCTVGHHDYPATGITEPVLWFRTCDTDTYHTDYHISLTITYKYRNNEDF